MVVPLLSPLDPQATNVAAIITITSAKIVAGTTIDSGATLRILFMADPPLVAQGVRAPGWTARLGDSPLSYREPFHLAHS